MLSSAGVRPPLRLRPRDSLYRGLSSVGREPLHKLQCIQHSITNFVKIADEARSDCRWIGRAPFFSNPSVTWTFSIQTTLFGELLHSSDVLFIHPNDGGLQLCRIHDVV